MHKRSLAMLLLVLAATLGLFSTMLAPLAVNYADPSARDGVLYVWFYALPIMVDQTLWLSEPLQMMGVAVVVYTLQYLAVLGLARLVSSGRASDS